MTNQEKCTFVPILYLQLEMPDNAGDCQWTSTANNHFIKIVMDERQTVSWTSYPVCLVVNALTLYISLPWKLNLLFCGVTTTKHTWRYSFVYPYLNNRITVLFATCFRVSECKWRKYISSIMSVRAFSFGNVSSQFLHLSWTSSVTDILINMVTCMCICAFKANTGVRLKFM